MRSVLPVVLAFALWAPPVAAAQPKSVKEREAEMMAKVTKARSIRQRAQTLARRGLHDTALATYERALRVYPKFPAVHNEIGVILVKRGQLDRALVAFRKALEMNPEMSTAWGNLAEVQRRLGTCGEALESYRQFLQRKPEDGPGYYGMAACFAKLDKKNRALWALERYMAVDPAGRYKREVTRQAAALIKAGVESEAPTKALANDASGADTPKGSDPSATAAPEVADPDTAAPAPGEPGRLKQHRGDKAFWERRYVDAIKAYMQQIAEQRSKPPKATQVTRPGDGKPPKVKRDARKKVAKTKKPEPSVGPVDVELLYKVGATYAVMGDYRLAIRWWRRALVVEPERELILRHIGLAARKLAEKGLLSLGPAGVPATRAVALAREHMGKGHHGVALSILHGMTDREAYYLRGEAALRLGKLEQARQNFEVILKQDASNSAALGGLSEALVRMHQLNDAQAALDKWLGDRMALPEDFLVMRAAESNSRIQAGPAADKPSDDDDDDF